MIFRVWIVAAVALGSLTASAWQDEHTWESKNFKLKLLDEIVVTCNLARAELTTEKARAEEFTARCKDAISAATNIKKKDKDKTAIILDVTGALEMGPNDPSCQALQEFINLLGAGYNIAVLCNCPQFDDKVWKDRPACFNSAGRYITINGNTTSRCIGVPSGGKIGLIYGMMFKNGSAKWGGAVHAGGKMRFVNCTFDGCVATGGDGYGGGALALPVFTSDLKDAFCPRKLSAKGDATNLELAPLAYRSCFHCTFHKCEASGNDGGAIWYKGRDSYCGFVSHCTFSECKAPKGDGGALARIEQVEGSAFSHCSAKDQGGAGYDVKEIRTSLCIECNANEGGAFWVYGYDTFTVQSCTIVSCTDKNGRSLDKSNAILDNSLVVGTSEPLSVYTSMLEMNKSVDASEAEVMFWNPGAGDYHLNPEYASRAEIATNGNDYVAILIPWLMDGLRDRDLNLYIEDFAKGDTSVTTNDTRLYVMGCYRHNSREELENAGRDFDWAILNPLVVTTPEDIVDPRDGQISFREACSNLLTHVAPPEGMIDQWPRITFDLPSNLRKVQITGEAVAILDSARKSPGDDPTSKDQYTPITIDGGAKGVTIARSADDDRPALKLESAGTLVNVSFENAPVEVGANKAAEAQGKFSPTVCATNCAFTGGVAKSPLVKVTGAGGSGLDFTHCTFVNPENATAAVSFEQTAAFPASFICCTFAGFDKGEGTVRMSKAGGTLLFGSCTFALNGPQAETAFADIWIDDAAKGGKLYLADCLFADGGTRAYRCPAESFTVYGEVRTDAETIPHNAAMDNFAGSAKNALDSTTPDRLTVGGVSQLAFAPKHTGSARCGKRTVFFDDGTLFEQPQADIFGAPQEGARTSLGSRFIDDVETRSMTVTIEEDVDDPYDDQISYREAIAHGLANYKTCAKAGYLTPVFSSDVFSNRIVRLTLRSAIDLGACPAFSNGCTVCVNPGTNKGLVFSSDPIDGSGIFRQAEGTRLKVDDVLFTDCNNLMGDGGVLESDGRTRFNRCRFEDCFSAEIRVLPAVRALNDAYAPVRETLAIPGARETVLRSIPPGRREQFVEVEGTLSNALEVCVRTIDIVRNIDISFEQRLDGSYACMTNFVGMTEGITEPFNVFRLYAPTIAMRLNAEGIYVNERELMASLDAAWSSMNEFTSLRNELADTNTVVAAMGSGGAIHLGPRAECIVYDASARGCIAFGGGGFLASEGDFKGVNLTLTGNNAVEGGCISCLDGTNQLAGVAIVDNVSETNGAVTVRGGAIGFLNSIVIANKGGSVAFAKDVTVTNVHSLVEGGTPIAKEDVFASTVALEGSVSNHLAQLYYPLKPNGLASYTGTFVFFNCETDKAQADGLDSEWIMNILHTTDPDGFTPEPQWLFGSGRPHWSAYLLYDLLGQLICIWENKETFEGPIPASMGPVPNVPPEAAGLIVTTFDDVVSTVDNKTSLREAAAYAMDMSTVKVVSVGFKLDGTYTLKNQIVVPSGRTLRISATRGRVTLKPAKTLGNRFFRVERGGRLELNGLTLDGGYAKGDYDVGMRPTNDDDGGAICSEGTLVLTDCTVQNCKANGYGGAVWSNGGMTATRCTFTENFAQRGGGICSYDEPLRLSGVSITDNIAQDYGGGLYLVTGANDVTATGMTITGNNAKGETVTAGPNRGGGVYLTANMSANPGTVTISGTVADNTGGNDSRDGGTEPVSNVETPEASEKVFVPPQPTPHLMSAVNALAATPVLAATSETVIDTSGTNDCLVLGGDYTASEQVRITGGKVCLTLTGDSPSEGTVEVKNRTYAEGKHPRITVEKGAKIEAERGFYCDDGSPRAELVLDNGTAELSGGAFVANAGGSSGTITLRNGALLDADMDITLNSDFRANTVSNSTVEVRQGRTLTVGNGVRLEMSDSDLLAYSLKIEESGFVSLVNCSNVLTTVGVRSSGEDCPFVIRGGSFRADTLSADGAEQSVLFDGVACKIGSLVFGPSRVEFTGGATAEFEQIGLGPSVTNGSCELVFDNVAAVCANGLDMRSDSVPQTLEFRGTNTGLRVSGDFSFGNPEDAQEQEHVLRFDIPRDGWAGPPLWVGGACQMSDGVLIDIPSLAWALGASNSVPLVGFASRPEFMTDSWLAKARDLMPLECTLKYDETARVLSVEYIYNPDGAPLCEINGVMFDSVEKALESAKPGETVRLITAARAGELHIPDFVTLDLNGFTLTRHNIREGEPGWQKFPDVVENGGVLVAYNRAEVDALFDGTFIGTMRFGKAVDWSRTGNPGDLMFPKGTDVTVRPGGRPVPEVYVVTTSLSDTYGLGEGWSVTVYGSAELGGERYTGCLIDVGEDVRVVTPMKFADSTLAVSGTVSFAEGAYIELGCLTNGGIYARNRIDFRYLRFSDPSQADVACTELGDGLYWYHPSEEAKALVAEVDFTRYTLRDAFKVANTNGHPVTLLRDDSDDKGTVAVGRDLTFDMNGHRIRGAGGANLTFSVSNGGFAVFGCGSEGCTDVTFQLGHGKDFDGSLILSGGSFAVAKGPAVTVDAACTNAAVVLTDGAKLLASAAVSEIVRLDGIADCLFDNATVQGNSAENAIVHHSARIVVRNGAKLVSRGVTIRQTASDVPSYDFTLEVSGEDSLVRTLAGLHCVASELTAEKVGKKSVTNAFTCVSGDFECPKADSNAAVAFFGDLGCEVTGGRFGGSVAPPVPRNYLAIKADVPDRELYWQVVRPGQPGVYVAKVGDERYESVDEAFFFVPTDGIVTMIANAGLYACIAVDRPATLDLNGFSLFTLGASRIAPRAPAFDVAKETALTIVDTIGSGRVSSSIFTVSGTLTVKGGTFDMCQITGNGTLEFLGGEFGENAWIDGTGQTELIIRDGTFRCWIRLQVNHAPWDNVFRHLEVSGGEYIVGDDYQPFCVYDKKNKPTKFLSGGVIHTTSDSRMSEEFLAEGYEYEDLPSGGGYRVVKEAPAPDVAAVGNLKYKSLSEAFVEANRTGKSVKLVADYTGEEDDPLSVTRSFALELNNHILAPSRKLDISIVDGASFDLDGMYDIAVCSNVHFTVGGESGSSKGTLHLVGGQYYGFDFKDASELRSKSIVTIEAGTCLMDYGATLEGTCPACLVAGTLAMTNATILGKTLGAIRTQPRNGSEKNFLRIGDGVRVYSEARHTIESAMGTVDLGISGDCEFHALSDQNVISCSALAYDQPGISGGLFFGKMSNDKDRYLAKGYAWSKDESRSCWTPVKEAPPQPTAIDGIRIEDGKVFRGDYEITDAVTVRDDGSVELNPGGSVGGVRVTPVIGDLPPGDGDETEPFAVGEGSVSLTVQTIPGLTYVLLRGETPDKVDVPVAQGMATKNVTTLEDFDKPKDGAFYLIKVMIK